MIILYIKRGFNKEKRLAPVHLAQFEDSSVIAEPLEFQLPLYTSCSSRLKLGTHIHF